MKTKPRWSQCPYPSQLPQPWKLESEEERMIWAVASTSLREHQLAFRALFNWASYPKDEQDAIISILMLDKRAWNRVAQNLVHKIRLPWKSFFIGD